VNARLFSINFLLTSAKIIENRSRFQRVTARYRMPLYIPQSKCILLFYLVACLHTCLMSGGKFYYGWCNIYSELKRYKKYKNRLR